jgi:hypothetical protein
MGRTSCRIILPVVILLLACSGTLTGQQYVYVNTDNLILRDRPEKKYTVFAILHAPCRLLKEAYEAGYKNDRPVTNRFYQVSFSYNDDAGIHHHTGGWVEKKYVVNDRNSVTINTAYRDTLNITEVPLIRYSGSDAHNPNQNASEFLPPKYKGGERQPQAMRRVYHKGPRGGCYYVNSKGRKVYVKGACR